MSLDKLCRKWMGYPVHRFLPRWDIPPEFAKTIYRFDSGPEWKEFIKSEGVEASPGVVMGRFDSDFAVSQLAEAAPQLPNVAGVFLGEVVKYYPSYPGDSKPILDYYPGLRQLQIRDAQTFSRSRHIGLRVLILEGARTGVSAIEELFSDCVFPNLEELEIWPNVHNPNETLALIEAFIESKPFPQLRVLRIRNYSLANEVALLIAQSSFLSQLEVLDLSLGMFGDLGARALLSNPETSNLIALDLRHHFMSFEMSERIGELKEAGVILNVDPALEIEGEQTITYPDWDEF
ncbi:MAG: hypothetical protein AAF585_25155 [Verrucomicrobiota bacterium]